jgi:hypothetical protein
MCAWLSRWRVSQWLRRLLLRWLSPALEKDLRELTQTADEAVRAGQTLHAAMMALHDELTESRREVLILLAAMVLQAGGEVLIGEAMRGAANDPDLVLDYQREEGKGLRLRLGQRETEG